MHFGGAMFFTDYSMSAMELARALEERGFESVWAPEHSPVCFVLGIFAVSVQRRTRVIADNLRP
jgi:hypothetical protein